MADRGRRRSSRRVVQMEEALQSMLKSHPLPEESVENNVHGEQPENLQNENMPLQCKPDRPATCNSGWSTQRSSSMSSLDDDEFDQESSEMIQHLFDDIDAVMYKDKPVTENKQQLLSECWEWMHKYPHLRVVGEQIHPDEDFGFQALSTDSSSIHTEISSTDDSAVKSASHLSIRGKHIDIHTIVDATITGNGKLHDGEINDCSIDEIFEVQGEYEELIAIDHCNDMGDSDDLAAGEVGLILSRRCSSPLREGIVDLLSNRLWGEVISWMQPLLTEFVEHVQHETPRITAHSTAPPVLPPSRASWSRLAQLPNMRLATAPPRSLLADSGILSVTSKTLQARQKKYNISDLPSTALVHHASNPEAGVVTEVRTPLVRSRRVPASGRLAPLSQIVKPSISEIKEDDWLPIKNIQRPKTAKQITPPRTGLSSSWGRPIMLPPIHHEDQQEVEPVRNEITSSHASRVPGSSRYKLKSALSRRKLLISSDKKSSLPSGPTIVSLPVEAKRFTSSVKHQKEKAPDKTIEDTSQPDTAASSPANVDSPTISESSDGFHTVEPFVSWLLNQVQTNACKAAESSSVNQAKQKSSKIE